MLGKEDVRFMYALQWVWTSGSDARRVRGFF